MTSLGGAVALAIVGFTWGGWHTEKGTAERAQTSVRIALIPECVIAGDEDANMDRCCVRLCTL